MAKKKTIFIIRDAEQSSENYEEIQSSWLDENHPDKTVVAGEGAGEFLVDEEDNSLISMEYVEY